MATQQTQLLARTLLTPAVALLFIWMIVPLALTIYFATLHYNLLDPGSESFVGLENFRYFLTDPAFLASLQNTLVLVGSVLAITIILGVPLAGVLTVLTFIAGFVPIVGAVVAGAGGNLGEALAHQYAPKTVKCYKFSSCLRPHCKRRRPVGAFNFYSSAFSAMALAMYYILRCISASVSAKRWAMVWNSVSTTKKASTTSGSKWAPRSLKITSTALVWDTPSL